MNEVKWTGGTEHWTRKGDTWLFLWHKKASPRVPHAGTVFFVHGSSMASQPTFDLQVPGRPYSSAMDWFCDQGFDTWTMDNEGYGRSDKQRAINFDISNGADDLAAGTEYVLQHSSDAKLLMYGISSGALKAALFTERHSERVAKLALDAFVWTGEGSPTLAQRRKKLPEFLARNRRAIDRAFVHSIFQRDHPGTADEATVNAFSDAILSLDDSMPYTKPVPPIKSSWNAPSGCTLGPASRGGSTTVKNCFTATLCNSCTMPDGHSMRTVSMIAASPRPKSARRPFPL